MKINKSHPLAVFQRFVFFAFMWAAEAPENPRRVDGYDVTNRRTLCSFVNWTVLAVLCLPLVPIVLIMIGLFSVVSLTLGWAIDSVAKRIDQSSAERKKRKLIEFGERMTFDDLVQAIKNWYYPYEINLYRTDINFFAKKQFSIFVWKFNHPHEWNKYNWDFIAWAGSGDAEIREAQFVQALQSVNPGECGLYWKMQKEYARPKPSVLAEWIKAKHAKVCPLIEWE